METLARTTGGCGKWGRLTAVFCGLCALLLAGRANAQQPVISKIEFYSTNQVLLHFDVQANTTCTLQYTSVPKTNVSSVTWSNLYAAPNLPFFEHYIIPDTRTAPQRFYRLQVAP